MTSVTCIIPSWNGREELEGCLAGLSRCRMLGAVVVVDNGSTDGTADWLETNYPYVEVIRNSRNLGFAAAVNQGVRASHSAWVALLNNDAVPDEQWLSELMAAAADPSIGAVASRMMFRDAPSMVSSAGIRMDVSAAPWDLWVGETTWPEGPVEVFGASGGACLLRREMLDDVGLFEESFFAFLEDADLAWRARLRGWRTVLAPKGVVHHALSATAGEGSAFKRYRLAGNKWRTIVRGYPMPALATYLPIVLGYDMLSMANSVRQGDVVPLRGRRDAFKDMAALLAQRKAIQARRTASWSDIETALSPLESPLTLYKRTRLVSRLASRRREGTAG